MTRVLFIAGFLLSSLLVFSSFIFPEEFQDTPKRKKTEKHIKLIKIDDEGNKMELDTVIENDDVFVWNGDTVGSGHEWHWNMIEDLNIDSLHGDFDFDFDFGEDGEEQVFIMKRHKGDAPFMYKFKHNDRFPPKPPHPPRPPKMLRLEREMKSNVIDLSDPGIISYKKSQKKNGTEKITIIREIPEKKSNDMMEEIIIHNGEHKPKPDIHFPGKKHKIKIIKENDGTEIIEEDGKVIRITKKTEGDEKEIEVEVEVNENDKQDNN